MRIAVFNRPEDEHEVSLYVDSDMLVGDGYVINKSPYLRDFHYVITSVFKFIESNNVKAEDVEWVIPEGEKGSFYYLEGCMSTSLSDSYLSSWNNINKPCIFELTPNVKKLSKRTGEIPLFIKRSITNGDRNISIYANESELQDFQNLNDEKINKNIEIIQQAKFIRPNILNDIKKEHDSIVRETNMNIVFIKNIIHEIVNSTHPRYIEREIISICGEEYKVSKYSDNSYLDDTVIVILSTDFKNKQKSLYYREKTILPSVSFKIPYIKKYGQRYTMKLSDICSILGKKISDHYKIRYSIDRFH